MKTYNKNNVFVKFYLTIPVLHVIIQTQSEEKSKKLY